MSTNVPVPALDLSAMDNGDTELVRKPSFTKKMSSKFKNLVTPRGGKPSTSPTGNGAPDIAKSSITSLFRVPSLPRKEPAVPAPTPFATATEPAAATRAPAATPAAATATAPAPAVAAPAAPTAASAPVFAPITAPVAPPRPAVTASAVPSSAPEPAVAAPAASAPDSAARAPPRAAAAPLPEPAAVAPAAPVAAPAPAAREPVVVEAPTPAKTVVVVEEETFLAAPEPATPGSAEWEQQASLEQSTSASEHSVTATATPAEAPADEAADVVVGTPAKDASPLTAKVKAPPRPGTREGKGLPRGLLTVAVLAVAAGLAISGSKKAQSKKPAPAILLVKPVGKSGWGRK